MLFCGIDYYFCLYTSLLIFLLFSKSDSSFLSSGKRTRVNNAPKPTMPPWIFLIGVLTIKVIGTPTKVLTKKEQKALQQQNDIKQTRQPAKTKSVSQDYDWDE